MPRGSDLLLANHSMNQHVKPPLGIDDLPKGLTGLRKAAIPTVPLYYCERMKIKIGKGNGCTRESRRNRK